MPNHEKNIVKAGVALKDAKKALILVHGRGATAQSILGLAQELPVEDFALLAPQATQNTWYPFSFMAPREQNEPGISSGLAVLKSILEDIKAAGIGSENIYLGGFSQGACLVSEFAAQNAQRFGGVFILSGGVIGQQVERENYSGDFAQTPILIGCSDIDAHVPLERVLASANIFREMGGNVTERIYPNAPHTVFQDEVDIMTQIIKANP